VIGDWFAFGLVGSVVETGDAEVPDDLSDTIATNAAGPDSVTADGVSVKQRSLKDLIDADRYLSGKAVADDPRAAFTRVKIVPPGTA
jgi:hypothetical protein